jgi:hypothetical protein
MKGIIALANEKVPFAQAAAWAGIAVIGETERGLKVYCPFGSVEHPDGGLEPAMRVYPDHAWCFAESRYFSVVSLLAEVWQVTREEAAAEAMSRSGYKPADYAERFTAAGNREQEPDRDALAAALVTWCEAHVPSWKTAQYEMPVARALSRCLGLLPLVRDSADCETWLTAAKQAMALLTAVN